MESPIEDHINPKHFHIFKKGRLTVVGFEGKKLSNFSTIMECRDGLLSLADHPECEILVVDLMDVEVVSSWLLGVLAAVQQREVEVHLYHPSPEIRGVLDVTQFVKLMKVRDSF